MSVICVETSLHSTAQLGMESVLHSDFPPNPDEGVWPGVKRWGGNETTLRDTYHTYMATSSTPLTHEA